MNLANRLTFEDLIKESSSIKKVFFFRICGTGMGAAACLLREKGLEVEGGDYNFYPPMSDYLDNTGIKLHHLNDFDANYLKNFDLIVVGNVVPKGSDQAKVIEESGVKFTSFPAALGALVLSDVNVIGIAGTHGKTTTTYLLTQILENLGEEPGYFIGGVLDNRPSSKLGAGKYFVIESDEYDSGYFEKISKFRLYQINTLILTSLEFDHADIFSDIEDIKDEFRALIPKLTDNLIYCDEYNATTDLVRESLNKSIKTFNYGESSIITQEESAEFTKFSLHDEDFETSLVGEHNIKNLASCIMYLEQAGFDLNDIKKAIVNLGLVKRRQEYRGKYKEMIVIDDFAHHPRAVETTIKSIRVKYPNKKIISILEPNSATARSALFQEKFTEALSFSDKVILAKPAKPTSVKTLKDIDCNEMALKLTNGNTTTKVATNLGELLKEIEAVANADNVLLVMSNGTCLDLWKSHFVDELV